MRNVLLFPKILFIILISISVSHAASTTYQIDVDGAHAFIQFRIKHLGYSWLWGRFNKFSGEFIFNEKDISSSSVSVEIDMNSIDSNHAERDKHLRDEDFFNVRKFPKASFVSTQVTQTGEQTGIIKGLLTLKGVTKEVAINAKYIGGGADPWGGYRQGFSGKTTIKLKDFNILKNLGPASQTAEVILSIEGIRK